MDSHGSKDVSVALPQVPPTVIALVIGLVVGLLVGFYLPRKQQPIAPAQQAAQNAQAQVPQAPPPPPTQAQAPKQQEQGFYGNIVSNGKDGLVIQEMLSAKEKGTRTFTVATTDQTLLTYQKPGKAQKDGSQTFAPESGKISDMKKDWFVYVGTKDDISTKTSITATTITYSEKSPFKE